MLKVHQLNDLAKNTIGHQNTIADENSVSLRVHFRKAYIYIIEIIGGEQWLDTEGKLYAN